MDTEKEELDPRLESRLGEELRQQLDRQLGRAAPHFLQQCVAENKGFVGRRQRHFRRLAFAATAASFCVALFAWQRLRPGQPPRDPLRELAVAEARATVAQNLATAPQPLATGNVDEARPPAAGETAVERKASAPSDPESASDGRRSRAAEPLIVGHTLKTRTLDEGTLVVGRRAVRKVRRQWLERVEWFDPQNGARVQRIVPHEEVVFVPLPIN